MNLQPRNILFTGYAPVHFLCFRPLYEKLMQLPKWKVYLSGGLKRKSPAGIEYDTQALYAPFSIPQERILSTTEIQTRDFDILFSAHTTLILPRSVARCIQIFHGISFRNKAIREENMTCDFYFLVGPYQRSKFIEAGLLTEDDPRGVSIGFPKTDPLLNGSLHREELFSRYGISGKRPVILYAPTGVRFNSLETMGEEIIEQVGKSDEYDLLIKLHDHPKDSTDWYTRLAPLESAHVKLVRDYDIIPLLFLADLLMTDASSVSSEYTLVDRPILFLDVPQLLAGEATKGGMLDVEWGRRGGLIVNRPDEVVNKIRQSLENPQLHSDIRRAMARELFYNPGNATEVAVNWLTKFVEDGL